MEFIKRVKETGLPLDEIIVVGSGVLAAHGIRDARDVDLIIDPKLFEVLEQDGSWERGLQGSSSYALQRGDIEVWRDWSTDGTGRPSYEDLLSEAEIIEGVRFVTLKYLEKRKIERSSDKDLIDVRLIYEYRKN